MATATATAIRQEAAIERIEAAAQKLGLTPAELADSKGRDPEIRIAEMLEMLAATLEQLVENAPKPAAKAAKEKA